MMNSVTQRTADYKLNNTTFRVTYGDITQQTVDGLVSSDDNFLSMDGGVSRAIFMAGGEVVGKEAKKHIPMNIGDVAVTSAGKLPAKYIFHAVTIDYTNMVYPSEKSIQAATLKCMQLADTLNVRAIAFPALGTGTGRFPFQLAAEVMTRTIADYLIGETHIELVVLTLFAREMVKESNLNLFYERAVARASVYTQFKRLNSLMAELKGFVNQMNMPSFSKRIAELQAELQIELKDAKSAFAEKQTNFEKLEQIFNQSSMGSINTEIINMSSQVQNTAAWEDKQLEAAVLRTKYTGLMTQLNIQTSNLNRFEIQKADYSIDAPPRLYNAIEDTKKEISETEARIGEVRTRLASLY